MECPTCGAALPAHAALLVDASVTYRIEIANDGTALAVFDLGSVTTYDKDREWYCDQCFEPPLPDEIADRLEALVRWTG